MSELEQYRARSLANDPGAGAYAVAYAMLRLAEALEGLSKTFTPEGRQSFERDYFLVRVAQRLAKISELLGPEPAAELLARMLTQKGRPKPRAP